jgi:membrane fusion protein (multidrug efflux system)
MPYDEPGGSAAPTDQRQATRAEAPQTERNRTSPARDPASGAGGGDDGAGQQKPRRSPWRLVILGVVILLAAIGGGWYWYANRNLETTDDAYTDGNAIAIAAQVSGQVADLAVNDNQFVHAGQVLIKLDPRLFIAARDQAQGQLEAAEGQLDAARAALDLARVTYPAKLLAAQAQRDATAAVLLRAQSDLRRQRAVERAATTQQDIDQATAAERQGAAQLGEAEANVKQAQPVQQYIDQASAQVKQLEGQVAQARAQLEQAQINLGYTTVTAPQDGWVTKRNVDRGNYVAAGAEIMSLVSPQVWVTANFKETQLDRMRPGQAVDIAVDAYPGLKLRGHVDSIQLGSGSKFTAFPPENATGNFVKIVQRVPVKIDIDSGLDPKVTLPLGISVEPSVELK